MPTRKRRGRRRIKQVKVKTEDLRISEEFIEGMREFGVSQETLEAAQRRNDRIARATSAAATKVG